MTEVNVAHEVALDRAEDLVEEWASQFPASRFTNSDPVTAWLSVGPREVVDLVADAYQQAQIEAYRNLILEMKTWKPASVLAVVEGWCTDQILELEAK
jgi:hypothetical protein